MCPRLCRVARGPQRVPPAFLPSARASGPPPFSCSHLQAASSLSSLEMGLEGPTPRTRLARPAPHTGAISYSYFGSGAKGRAGRVRWGSLFIYFPPTEFSLSESIGGHPLPPDNASINPFIQGSKCPGATEGSLCSCSASLPRPGQLSPTPHNCSDSTETGLSSNNVL